MASHIGPNGGNLTARRQMQTKMDIPTANRSYLRPVGDVGDERAFVRVVTHEMHNTP